MVPIKTSDEMDRTKPGATQIDCVEHCGSSASGDYVISLTTTDVFSGWWEKVRESWAKGKKEP